MSQRDMLDRLHSLLVDDIDPSAYRALEVSGIVRHLHQLRPFYHWSSWTSSSICQGWLGGAWGAFWARDQHLDPRTINRVALSFRDDTEAHLAATNLFQWLTDAISATPAMMEEGPSITWGMEPRWSFQDQVLLSGGPTHKRVHLGWRRGRLVVHCMITGDTHNEVEAFQQASGLDAHLEDGWVE